MDNSGALRCMYDASSEAERGGFKIEPAQGTAKTGISMSLPTLGVGFRLRSITSTEVEGVEMSFLVGARDRPRAVIEFIENTCTIIDIKTDEQS